MCPKSTRNTTASKQRLVFCSTHVTTPVHRQSAFNHNKSATSHTELEPTKNVNHEEVAPPISRATSDPARTHPPTMIPPTIDQHADEESTQKKTEKNKHTHTQRVHFAKTKHPRNQSSMRNAPEPKNTTTKKKYEIFIPTLRDMKILLLPFPYVRVSVLFSILFLCSIGIQQRTLCLPQLLTS